VIPIDIAVTSLFPFYLIIPLLPFKEPRGNPDENPPAREKIPGAILTWA
jgi:hypothetical protein